MLARNYSRFFSSMALPISHTSNMIPSLDLRKAPAFLELSEHHEKGDLKIQQITSIPRSGSTSLFRSFTETKEATSAIFEPFLNRKNISWEEKLDHGARITLERFKLLSKDHQPVVLVMKEIATYLPAQIMQHWQTVVDNFIFLIEDPHKQMYSFLHMLANGRTFGLKDANGKPLLDSENNVVMHTEEQMRALWPAVTDMLAKNHFQQTAWEQLTKLTDMVALHCKETHKKMVIIDGSILKLMPEQTLRSLTKKLNHCTFRSAMVSSWDKTSGKLFFHPNAPSYDPVGADGVTRSMWIWPALAATSFAKPAVSYPTDTFPPKLAEYILSEALPAYQNLMNHPAFLLPAEIPSLVEQGFATCPITLITLLKILLNTQDQSQGQYLSYYDRIIHEHPGFSAAFDVLSTDQDLKKCHFTDRKGPR